MKKDNLGKILIGLMGIALLITLIAAINVIRISADYKRSEGIYTEAAGDYTRIEPVHISESSAVGEENTNSSSEDSDYGKSSLNIIEADIEGLRKINPEVAGWLYFENEDISYPLMQTVDNERYLKEAFDGTRSSAGSIFLDYRNSVDLTDCNSVIYGHNMKDLSMFGRLRYYKTGEEYTESHKFFQIYTGECIYRYEVIGCRDISANSDIYVSFDLSDSDEIRLMQNEIMKGSYINSGETLSEEQRYVTLSTCSVDESVRFVVLGKQIDIIVHDTPDPQSSITDGL